jgi:hypothetical protein
MVLTYPTQSASIYWYGYRLASASKRFKFFLTSPGPTNHSFIQDNETGRARDSTLQGWETESAPVFRAFMLVQCGANIGYG